MDLDDGRLEHLEQESWILSGKPRLRTITDDMSAATKFFVEKPFRAIQQHAVLKNHSQSQDSTFVSNLFIDEDGHKRNRRAAIDTYGLAAVLKHEAGLWMDKVWDKRSDAVS